MFKSIFSDAPGIGAKKNKTEPNIYPPIKNSALSYRVLIYIVLEKSQAIFLKNFIFCKRFCCCRSDCNSKKNPGIELLSHTLMCSTIVARLLIDRVRDGNVSFKPAIDTGKKYVIKIVVILLDLREEAKQLLTTRVEF